MTILEPAVLVFQQTKNIMKNDFAILDGGGVQVAHVETGGSSLGRMFAGSRSLTVFDGPENPVLQVKDAMGLGRDKMEILDGQGNHMANMVKRITFFKTRVTLDYQGEEIDLTGNLWGFNFQIESSAGVLATVSREWSGMGNAVLGKSTYAVQFTNTIDAGRKLALIGAVLALDLIREKENRC
ncbi:phospholipid scramblase-related protein [Glutamicibacter sp.]|uniref:LURP-one-related/scramblase family protein n=1 Tax=Glutamicibacter sp. TaxID=1931995 RepID=UPI0028BD1508|nr:phospholipid scramblase-related protein [Glutamicibacter sp.]